MLSSGSLGRTAPQQRQAGGALPARPRPAAATAPRRRLGLAGGARHSTATAVASVEQRAVTCELGAVLHTPHPSTFLNHNTSFMEEFRIRRAP